MNIPFVVTTAAIGKPLPIPFAKVTMSGTTSCVWNPQKWLPVRPNPVCTFQRKNPEKSPLSSHILQYSSFFFSFYYCWSASTPRINCCSKYPYLGSFTQNTTYYNLFFSFANGIANTSPILGRLRCTNTLQHPLKKGEETQLLACFKVAILFLLIYSILGK